MEKSCLVCIDVMERYDFFSRLTSESYSFKFITLRSSVYVKARFSGFNCHLVKNSRPTSSNSVIDISRCRDVLSGFINVDDAHELSVNVINYLDSNFSEESLSYVLLWNGTDAFERTVSFWAKKRDIPVFYLEISNLPGKLFIDYCGVNAESSIHLSEGRNLLPLEFDKERVDAYIERYKKVKSSSYVLPQTIKATSTNYLFAIDVLLRFFLNGAKFQSRNLSDKIRNIKSRKTSKGYEFFLSTVPERFVFLPLQVSNDSQLKLNSKVDNIKAIEIANNIAKETGCRLVVKIHPAEKDLRMFSEYESLQKDFDFIISDDNTVSLVVKSHMVITINSTVGLEGLIFGKDVRFLGDAFYSFFEGDDIYRYIDAFLYDCDYFGLEKIFFDDFIDFVEKRKMLMDGALCF